jgi:predicted ATPase
MVHDPTDFIGRSFAVVENKGHSIRLINRESPRSAISIPWKDLSALRELLNMLIKEDETEQQLGDIS